jgi:hypothetical protein
MAEGMEANVAKQQAEKPESFYLSLKNVRNFSGYPSL